MKIETYYTDDTTKPIEYVIKAEFIAQEKDMAFKVINEALWIANPLNEARPAHESDEEYGEDK